MIVLGHLPLWRPSWACRLWRVRGTLGISIYDSIGSLTPLTPFLSLSSMKSERYSGDFWFKLMKYSKSEEIICLKSLSSLNDSWRKWSKRSFKSSKLWKRETRNPSSLVNSETGNNKPWKNNSFTTVVVSFRSVSNVNFLSVCNVNFRSVCNVNFLSVCNVNFRSVCNVNFHAETLSYADT